MAKKNEEKSNFSLEDVLCKRLAACPLQWAESARREGKKVRRSFWREEEWNVLSIAYLLSPDLQTYEVELLCGSNALSVRLCRFYWPAVSAVWFCPPLKSRVSLSVTCSNGMPPERSPVWSFHSWKAITSSITKHYFNFRREIILKYVKDLSKGQKILHFWDFFFLFFPLVSLDSVQKSHKAPHQLDLLKLFF